MRASPSGSLVTVSATTRRSSRDRRMIYISYVGRKQGIYRISEARDRNDVQEMIFSNDGNVILTRTCIRIFHGHVFSRVVSTYRHALIQNEVRLDVTRSGVIWVTTAYEPTPLSRSAAALSGGG